MRIVRAEEVEELSGVIPEEAQRIAPQWWEGPHDDGRLNAVAVDFDRRVDRVVKGRRTVGLLEQFERFPIPSKSGIKGAAVCATG